MLQASTIVDEGLVGNGKTQMDVLEMLEYLAMGHICASNFELNRGPCDDHLRDVYGVKIDWDQNYVDLDDQKEVELHPEGHCERLDRKTGKVKTVPMLAVFYRHVPAGTREKPTRVYIDEAPLWLDSRQWNTTPEELLMFIRQIRRQFTEVVFVTQLASDLDKKIRTMAQFVRSYRCLKTVGIQLFPFVTVRCPFPITMRTTVDMQGNVFKRDFIWRQPKYFKLYNSYSMHKEFARMGKREVQTTKVKSKGLNMNYVFMLMIAVAGLSFTVNKIYKSNAQLQAEVGDLKEKIDMMVRSKVKLPSTSEPGPNQPAENPTVAVIFEGENITRVQGTDNGLRKEKYMVKNP